MKHEISSPDNTLFRTWRDCLQSKGIKKHGEFLIFGERAVRDTLERNAALARNLLLSQDVAASFQDLRREAKELAHVHHARFSEVILTNELFAELDVFGTKAPILVLSTPEIPEADLSRAPKGLEILCALQDPANLGALIRSASAFGASSIVTLKECASPFHPKAVRAASGNVLATEITRGPSIKDLPELASAHRSQVWVALHMQGEPIQKFKWPHDVRLVLGEEGQGVPESKSFTYVSIPMANGVESLNAAVAMGIAMFAYRSHNHRS